VIILSQNDKKKIAIEIIFNKNYYIMNKGQAQKGRQNNYFNADTLKQAKQGLTHIPGKGGAPIRKSRVPACGEVRKES